MATKSTTSTKSSAGTNKAPRREDKPAPVTDPAIAAAEVKPPEPRPSTVVPLASIIIRDGWNIRKYFDDAEHAALVESVRKHGVMEPILLTAAGEEGRFHLVAGERRLRAATAAGLAGIPAIVITSDETSAAEDENFKRAEITHADRCRYVKVKRDAGMPFAAIATIIGKSEQTAITDYGIATKLLPEIFDAWSRYPLASKIALEIYAKGEEEQRRAWGEWLAKRAAKEADGGKNKRGKKGATAPGDDGGPTKRSKGELSAVYADLRKLRDALTPGDPDMSWLDGAIWALEHMASSAVPLPPHYAKRIDAVKNPKQAKLFG